MIECSEEIAHYRIETIENLNGKMEYMPEERVKEKKYKWFGMFPDGYEWEWIPMMFTYHHDHEWVRKIIQNRRNGSPFPRTTYEYY